MEAAAGEANGTTREALKGNKSGWYLPRNSAEDVNPLEPCSPGAGRSPEGSRMGDSDRGDGCLGREKLGEPVETGGRLRWWEAGLAEGLHPLRHRGPLLWQSEAAAGKGEGTTGCNLLTYSPMRSSQQAGEGNSL